MVTVFFPVPDPIYLGPVDEKWYMNRRRMTVDPPARLYPDGLS